MGVTIDLTNQEIARLKQLTQENSDAEAVHRAVHEFLRIARLRQLKSISGKVDFDDRSEDLEAIEFDERPFPQ